MNRIDFTPYRRSTVGFDRLFDLLENNSRNGGGDNYPPFNIERRDEDAYRITLAVAGFKPADLDITAQQNLLTVQGRKRDETHDGELVHGGHQGLLGESWARGPVVLSWDDALRGGLDASDGHNVVIHEFAHQLDGLSGHVNGVPILRKGQAYAGWEQAMLDAYRDHGERLDRGEPTLIDPYGATNHQEFFAEAIVTFFEKSAALKRERPALYTQLSRLLDLDPAAWGQ